MTLVLNDSNPCLAAAGLESSKLHKQQIYGELPVKQL